MSRTMRVKPNGGWACQSKTGKFDFASITQTVEVIELAGRLLQLLTSALGTLASVDCRVEHDSSTRVFQTSIFSAISRASSTSTPRYRTVLSILWWPRSNCAARRFPVRR